jgi:hypothetical protein
VYFDCPCVPLTRFRRAPYHGAILPQQQKSALPGERGTGVHPQAGITTTPKVKKKRRGIRLNSRVPVAIEWQKTDATPACREEAFTRVVGPYGCLVVLRESLEVEQALRIVNLTTNVSNSAVIVWQGNERPEGWELGIELIHPEMDFWGLEL